MLGVTGGATFSNGAALYQTGGGQTTVGSLTADGTIRVGGADSTLTIDETLILGSNGDGVLSLTSGGALIVDGDFDMAENDGSTSTATIGEADVTLTIHGLWQIGVAGIATASIIPGVTAEALGGIALGVQSTGTGKLTVSASLSVTGHLVIGEAGAGTLNVKDGGAGNAAKSAVTVGDLAGSTGALTLTGSGATMTAGSMEVGGEGAGTLTVDQGASLTIGGDLQIGADGTVAGSVNLADTGSTLSVGGNLVIGSGSLTVDADATLAVTGDLIIGDDGTDSSADVTSSPATTSIAGDVTLKVDKDWTLRDTCVIGDNAKGTLTIDSSSSLNANENDIRLGSQKTGNGQLTVDGGGAELDNIKDLDVGASGAGTVLIENLGSVHASFLDDGSPDVLEGEGTGGHGESNGVRRDVTRYACVHRPRGLGIAHRREQGARQHRRGGSYCLLQGKCHRLQRFGDRRPGVRRQVRVCDDRRSGYR